MKRVLVTGATGFIGRNTLSMLVERGFEVHATFRESNLPLDVTWHRCDLLNAESARAVVRAVSPSHLLHLAWYAEHGKFWGSPRNLEWVAASLLLMRSFQECGGTRVVIAGSCAEYDWEAGVCTENSTPLKPLSFYGVAKNAVREVAEGFAQSTGLSFAWGRIFFLYGPHEAAERLVPSVARALIQGNPARCTSGEQRRDFLHVEDVADAFVSLLDSELSGAVNIGSGHGVRVRDVVDTIASITGGSNLVRFGAIPDRLEDPPVLIADTHRANCELGWVPRWSLPEGLSHTVDWWRAEGRDRL